MGMKVRMRQRTNLVILNGQIFALPALLVRNLHKEPTNKDLSDVLEEFLLV
jgi:hypothetical protein